MKSNLRNSPKMKSESSRKNKLKTLSIKSTILCKLLCPSMSKGGRMRMLRCLTWLRISIIWKLSEWRIWQLIVCILCICQICALVAFVEFQTEMKEPINDEIKFSNKLRWKGVSQGSLENCSLLNFWQLNASFFISKSCPISNINTHSLSHSLDILISII